MMTSAAAKAVAGRSVRQLPTGWQRLGITRILRRCDARIPAMAGQARFILSCGDGAEPNASGQRAGYDQRKDFRHLFEIINCHRFIELVHGRIAQAKFDHRHDLRQKAGVGGAA